MVHIVEAIMRAIIEYQDQLIGTTEGPLKQKHKLLLENLTDVMKNINNMIQAGGTRDKTFSALLQQVQSINIKLQLTNDPVLQRQKQQLTTLLKDLIKQALNNELQPQKAERPIERILSSQETVKQQIAPVQPSAPDLTQRLQVQDTVQPDIKNSKESMLQNDMCQQLQQQLNEMRAAQQMMATQIQQHESVIKQQQAAIGILTQQNQVLINQMHLVNEQNEEFVQILSQIK